MDFAIPSTVTQLVCDHNQALEVSLGACLPLNCSPEESALLVQHVTKHPVHIRCEARGQWSTAAIVVGVLIIIWLLMLWLATFAHWWVDTKNFSPTVSELVVALSLQRNATESMRTKRDEAPNFHAAQGIQVVSLFLLASGYVFYLMMPYLGNLDFLDYLLYLVLENPMFAYEFSYQFIYQPFMNFSFYVDGLLALGALRLALKPSSTFETFSDLLKQLFRRFAR